MYNRVLFIGSKLSGYRVLKLIHEISPDTLVGCVTINDSEDGRSEYNSILDYCHNMNISVDVLDGKCDLTDSIRKYKPDLCIVMGWYYIIPLNLLEKVKGGFIGIHNSLLPLYRGFAPVVWAIISGESETGFSVFSFDKGMDTGKIWYQEKVDIVKFIGGTSVEELQCEFNRKGIL